MTTLTTGFLQRDSDFIVNNIGVVPENNFPDFWSALGGLRDWRARSTSTD